jgi:hypothetical protein
MTNERDNFNLNDSIKWNNRITSIINFQWHEENRFIRNNRCFRNNYLTRLKCIK